MVFIFEGILKNKKSMFSLLPIYCDYPQEGFIPTAKEIG